MCCLCTKTRTYSRITEEAGAGQEGGAVEVVPLLEKFNAAACVDHTDLLTAYCSLGGDKAGGVLHGTDRVVAWTIASDLDAGLFPYRLVVPSAPRRDFLNIRMSVGR